MFQFLLKPPPIYTPDYDGMAKAAEIAAARNEAAQKAWEDRQAAVEDRELRDKALKYAAASMSAGSNAEGLIACAEQYLAFLKGA